MSINNEKIQRLIGVAKAYYEEDKNQSEIAKDYGVSRPFISRLLKEARDLGIVTIDIRSPLEQNNLLLNQLCSAYKIQGGMIVARTSNDNTTNEIIAEAAIDFIYTLRARKIAVGWGTIIGLMAGLMGNRPHTLSKTVKSIFPLIGNSSVSNRNYHSSEIVRIFAAQSSAKPLFWYTPAFVESKTEEQNIKDLENYKVILDAWKHMDVAVVNIGNYPSVPDLATQARYQDKLTKNRAVGRFLSYYYDIQGQIIHSETDFTLQIPLDILSGCACIIGVCASNTTPGALAGALRSGVITHIIATKELAQATLNLAV